MTDTSQEVESYYAGAYWGPRKESTEECARRAEVFLAAMANVDPSFSHWFQQGKSRRDALKRPIDPSRAAIEKLIRRGKDRQFEELGYSVWAWNGVCSDYEDCGFNFACGVYAEGITNRCVLNLPSRGPNAEVEDKGSLVILSPELPTVTNPAHVDLAQRVREVLDREGLLVPVTS